MEESYPKGLLLIHRTRMAPIVLALDDLRTIAIEDMAEQSGGVIVGKARRLRIDTLLPEDLWPEFIRTAVYLINRSPTRILDWQTPIERLGQLLGINKRKPNLFQVEIYGCRSYARIRNLPKKRKVAARALIGCLVGYEGTRNGEVVSSTETSTSQGRV
jgi:hypothetical protein